MARVINTNSAASPARVSLFDSGGRAPSSEERIIDPARRVGGVDLPPGKMLSKAVGDPHNGDFFSWDNVMAERGAAIASCDADGTPTMIKGQLTGKGTVPGSAPRSGLAAQPEPEQAPVNYGQQARGIPFASELAKAGFAPASTSGGWIDWSEHDSGVRGGLEGGVDRLMVDDEDALIGAMHEPPSPAASGRRSPATPTPSAFSSPSTAPGSTPSHQGSMSPSSAMMSGVSGAIDQLMGLMKQLPGMMHAKAGPAEGRGAGEEFVYGRDDKASKDEDDEALKSFGEVDVLGVLERLIKGSGGGHKYTRRRGTKGHYEYDYGDGWGKPPKQTSLFGDDVMSSKKATDAKKRKPREKAVPDGYRKDDAGFLRKQHPAETSLDRARKHGDKLSAAAKKSAAKDGNLKVLFASEAEASAGRGASASDMEAIAANFAQAMSVGPSATGEAPKYGMAAVYAKEGIVGLRRQLEQTTSPRKLTRVQVDGVMNRARHLAAKIRDGMTTSSAKAEAGYAASREQQATGKAAAERAPRPSTPGDWAAVTAKDTREGKAAGAKEARDDNWDSAMLDSYLKEVGGPTSDFDAGHQEGLRTQVAANEKKRETPKHSRVEPGTASVSSVATEEARQEKKAGAGRGEFEADHDAVKKAPIAPKANAVVSALSKFRTSGNYGVGAGAYGHQATRRELVNAVAEVTAMKAPRSLAGKRAHVENLRQLSDHMLEVRDGMQAHRNDAAGRSDMTFWKNRDALLQVVDKQQKHVSKKYWSARSAADRQEKRATTTEKSMYAEMTMTDTAGRVLRKGLHSFESSPALPDDYLYDYLRAFVEQSASSALQKSDGADVPTQVMRDLVRYIGENPELARASASVGGCTKETVAQILLEKSGERSVPPDVFTQAVPWFDTDPAPVVERNMAPRGLGDVSHLVKSDGDLDPFQAIQLRQRAAVHALWDVPELPATLTAVDNCPVHSGRDITKSMNLWNPMQPCMCTGSPNAYG